jgi:hypothetical protein
VRALLLAAAVLSGAGCAVAPVPAWHADTRDALDSFTSAYLAGNSRTADRYFRDARTSIAGTGRPDLAARVDLIRCAIGTAALDPDACAASDASRADLAAGDRAYADFLAGALDAVPARELPGQYRSIAQAKGADAQLKALREIEEPLSRLVAAGALFRAGRLSPDGIAVAVDTASEQAWRRPLLAYLNVQLKLAEQGGDAAAADAIRKRVDLIYQSPAPGVPPPGEKTP